MLPAASSGAPLAILATAKIVQRPTITHWIKVPDDRFMIKKQTRRRYQRLRERQGQGSGVEIQTGEARQIHGVAGQERRRRAQPSIQSITSDNICHIKSLGVASDWGGKPVFGAD